MHLKRPFRTWKDSRGLYACGCDFTLPTGSKGFEESEAGEGCIDVDECKHPKKALKPNAIADASEDGAEAADDATCNVDHFCRCCAVLPCH